MIDPIHQARLDSIFQLLPCIRGKPALTFDRTPASHGQYCFVKHEINLDLQSMPDASRLNPYLSNDDFWLLSLAHEYCHAYIPTTIKENLAYREKGPAYVQHEMEMDKLAGVIIRALAGEERFPARDQVKGLLGIWNGIRGQYFLEVSARWSARMREEYPPFPPPQKRKPPKRKPKPKA